MDFVQIQEKHQIIRKVGSVENPFYPEDVTAKYLIIYIDLIGFDKGSPVKEAFIRHLVTAHLPSIETPEEFIHRVMNEHTWINAHLSRLVGYYALEVLGLGISGARFIGRAVIHRYFLQTAIGETLGLNYIYKKVAQLNKNFNSVIELRYDEARSRDGLVVIKKRTKKAYKNRLVNDLGKELLNDVLEMEDQVTKGILESGPKFINTENDLAQVVSEPFCELHGDAYCEYHIRFKESEKGLFPFINRLTGSLFSNLLFMIPSVKRMGEHLIAMELSIQRQTRDLSDTQIKLEDRVMKRTRELRKLNAHLVRTEEREKKILADALHEGLGQELAISRILTGQLASECRDRESVPNIEKLKDYIDGMIAKTRAMTNDLSPPVLHELGLEDALVWLSNKVADEHNIQVQLNITPGDRPLDSDERIMVFRVTKELFMNIIKHSRADRVWLTFNQTHELIYLLLKDNGVGFDPALLETFDSPANTGYGLYSIRDRVRFAGGRFKIESKPGKGCKATLSLPYIR